MRSILAAFLLTAVVFGQRQEPELEWQKHKARIEYNVVQVGRHKLDELQVNQNWRMGRNEASQLKTDMALLVGEDVITPGSYRVGVFRSGEKDFSFAIEGGSLGAAPQASPASVYSKAEFGKPEKPSKNLEVALKADGKAANTVQPAKITVTFGENQLTAPMSLVGTKTQKSGGWTLDAFLLPGDLVEKRMGEAKAVPLAALKKETGKKDNPFHVWNLVVTKDSAELWPAPVSPKDAFSGIDGLSAANMAKATSVKWEDGKEAKPALELVKFEVAKGKGATIVIAVGKQTCTIAIPEPKVPG
jgi:hypothetical protein